MNGKKNTWYIYITEYYLVMRKEDILPFVTTWMDFEYIMLSKISQTKTSTVYHLYMESKKVNPVKSRE